VLGRRLWWRIANAASSALATTLQLVQNLGTNLIPRSSRGGTGPVCLQAFFEHLSMPIRYGNVLRMSGDSVPKRLDVLELLVRREIVESRGRDGESSRHDPNLQSSV
jgi:hypothetical protein